MHEVNHIHIKLAISRPVRLLAKCALEGSGEFEVDVAYNPHNTTVGAT